uniref:FAR1 domain-containing protein n=2 Tax=Mesocestoides corti TaxID=53468 RepID=A0A5K3EK87_MESCO
MDFNEEFQETVASLAFPTYELLEDAIRRFTKITGSQFALKKKVRHRTGAPMRDAHKFRYALFRCICSFSTECEAFFNVASKGQTLRVTQFYMVHNHAVVYNPAFKQRGVDDDEGYDVRCDLTVQFEEFFPVKSFATFDEFLTKLQEFQDATGCIFVKRNADRYPPEAIDKQHLVYKAVKMECVHYGHRQDSKKPSHTNLRISCKIGCRCCIHISTYKGRVAIGKYFMKHNHPVPIEEAIQYPQATHLSACDDSHYNVVYDVTTQFVEIFSSGRFPTYQDFLVRLEEFQRETGCLYSKRMSNMWPAEAKDKEHLVYKFVIFDCVHFGYTRDNSRRRSTQRRAGFCFRGKVGCKSTMRISTIKGYVEIVTYEMRHNHPASQEASDEYQPQNWLLSGINVGDDDKAFKRRRRPKKQALASSSASQSSTHEKTDIISSQLTKLKEIAMSASSDKLEIFCGQLSDFEIRWRQRLIATYQQSEDLPDPNSSPPILPSGSTIKLETL